MDKKESQQKPKKGPAPFASVEDLSDDSPEDKSKLEVPGARAGVTPRIDISRASSSSHHEDSSPERELFGGEGGGVKVGLGFTEDMALELRSSTEELDFHEPERKGRRKKLQQQQAVVVTKYDLEAESEKENRERKDSGCSEGGLLFIGGRTSRLSSIGSAASGGSGVSAGSAVSHLSAASNLSRASRCSSPHKMLLETSFCGPKPIPTLSLEAEYPPSESVEAALLKRKADPTGAILPNCLEVRDNKPRRCSSERTPRPQVPIQAARSSSARAPKRPNLSKKSDNELIKIIPLHGSLEDDDDESPNTQLEDDFNPENGIYIPLKGPIIDCRKAEEPKRKKPDIEESDLFKFISLYGDDEEVQNKKNNQSVQFKSWEEAAKWVEWSKPRSPEPPKPGRLELEKKKNGRSLGQIPRDDSRTPSPASSFSRGNIFRRSSDSSGSSKKSGGSGDSKSKKEGRNKSMFTALFRKNVKDVPVKKSIPHEKAAIDPKLTNVEYKFKQEDCVVIDKDTIIIPLHSPDEIVEPLMRYDPTNDDSDLLKDIRPEIKTKPPVPENQRSSLEEHTIEKNIVVVDVINEDTREPVKNEAQVKQIKGQFIKAERKDQVKYDMIEQTKSEPRVVMEIKKSIKEISKKVDELEIQHLEFEPKVRRSSSICSREVEYLKEEKVVTSNSEEVNTNTENENQESIESDRQESEETVRQASQETVIENPMVKEEDLTNNGSLFREDAVLSSVIQDEEIESLIKKDDDSENNLTKSEGLERQSSESEVDMEVEKEVGAEECDEERKGLFHQTDSQEDELPYVPTTLPQERSVAVPIIPIRQRVSEVKTCPVERPRSTTPIQPSNLEEYVTFHEPRPPPTQEKMQITLPRC